jgi:hypothetical protein
MEKPTKHSSLTSRSFRIGCFGATALFLLAMFLGFFSERSLSCYYLSTFFWFAAILAAIVTIVRGYKRQTCPSCNYRIIGIGIRNRFCPKCGASWELPRTDPDAGAK